MFIDPYLPPGTKHFEGRLGHAGHTKGLLLRRPFEMGPIPAAVTHDQDVLVRNLKVLGSQDRIDRFVSNFLQRKKDLGVAFAGWKNQARMCRHR